MKKIIIIAIAAVLAVSLALGAGAAIYNNQPEVVTVNAIKGVFEEISDREELQPILEMLKGGSLEIQATADTEKMGEDFEGFKATLEAGGKIYFGDEEYYFENIHANANVPMLENEISFSADAYVCPEYAYVTNESLLHGTYGIVKGELTEEFKNSAWAKELDEDLYNYILSVLEALESDEDSEFVKDLKKILDEYSDELIKSISEHAEYKTKTKDVEVGGSKEKSRVVTITIDADTIVNVARDMHQLLKEDEQLLEFAVKYSGYYKDALKMFLPIADEDNTDKIEDLYDEALDELEKLIDELEEESKDIKTELVIEVVTPTLSSTLRKLSVSIEDSSFETTVFVLDLGKDGIAKTDFIQVTVMEKFAVTFEVEENNSKYYEAKLTYGEVSGSGDIEDEELLFDLSIDKRDESYRVKLLEGKAIVSGSLVTKRNTTTITVDSITIDEEKINKGFELTIILSTGDKMPKPINKDDVKTIFDITVEDVEAIFGKAEDYFEDIL